MPEIFPRIAILGGGLLGGSLALALGSLAVPPRVRLWARREATLAEAARRGIRGATGDLHEALDAVDLVVLAVPVGSMPELVRAAVAAGLPHNALVTDVGSVKQLPYQSLTPLLAAKSITFIGSHPMAGSEREGIAAADARLFNGAACLLTNDGDPPPSLASGLERFWQAVGCQTTWMNAAAHDALVARISHLPHILAACGARIALANPADGRFAGGGLRDTTRVASGNADMWAEILTSNRLAVAESLRESIADLTAILDCVDCADRERARQWLATAKQRRDSFCPPT